MSWTKMNVAPVNEGEQRKVAWEYEENLIAPGNGKSVLIPDEIIFAASTMSFTGGGSGKVQVTTDPVDIVKSGSGITWVDSWWGEASDTYCDLYFPVTAIRMVQINARAMKMTLRAQ